MARVVYLRTCPNCGERAALLTIRHVNGHVAKAVFCSSHSCNVNTGFSYGELPDVFRRWNEGVGLEHRNGDAYHYHSKPRALVATVIEL